MANKDPAVLFYTSDFLAGASLMTMKERGQYITLLCLQRERGHMDMKEMEKAAGKLSEEVKSKFTQDEDGKFFNPRMEKEIQKRDAHCKKQKENVSKRWNKPNVGVGNNDGNTMVLPLGNGNNNVEGIGNVSLEAETTPPVVPPDAAVAGVFSDFLNRVNPTASQRCLDELMGYVKTVGPAVCKRAFDIALDEKKATWSYIRAILADKQARGIKCLADWDAADAARKKQAGAKKSPTNMAGANFQPTAERIQQSSEWLDKFLEEQKEA